MEVLKIPTLFNLLVTLCKNLESTSKRKEKIRLISEILQKLEPNEISPFVLMLIGFIFPETDNRTLDVGWRTLKPVLEKRGQTLLYSAPLTILEFSKRSLTQLEEGQRKINRTY